MQVTPDDSMTNDCLGVWIGWGGSGVQIMQDFSLLKFEI